MLDAFSSDAIPVHLVTQQALDVYLSRLAPGGVLAFHISNRHLALRPVLAALADARGLAARVQLDQPTARQQAEGRSASEWFLMARDARDFASLSADPRWQTPRAPEGGRVWTDDFSDILGVLKPIW
jgi:hypothetical protein